MPDPTREIDLQRATELALKKCDNALSESETEELCGLLSRSNEAREEYWRLIAVHSELQWELGGRNDIDRNTLRSDNDPGRDVRSGVDRRNWSPTLAWAAVAAAVLLSVSLTGWTLNRGSRGGLGGGVAQGTPAGSVAPNPIGGIAPLVGSSTWSFGRPGADNSTTVFPGDTVCLDRGAIELRLTSDTVAVLEAPAIVQTVSVDRFRLIRGGVKVEVAKGAEGFSVETSSAEVIDLGTVFSVSVNGDATDLVVYDGEVDLKVANLPEDSAEPLKRFRAGEAVQVQQNGTLSRIVQVQQSPVVGGESGENAPLITAVRDDNVRDDFWSFYEIVPGGMREDAPAFVDRPHQWNGRNSNGMPDYLVGGDYVKTFNDDKVTGGLQIEVTLDCPATLYVLLDRRGPARVAAQGLRRHRRRDRRGRGPQHVQPDSVVRPERAGHRSRQEHQPFPLDLEESGPRSRSGLPRGEWRTEGRLP